MASKPSKPKSFAFFLIALLLFSIYYLRQLNNISFQTAVTYPTPARNPKWFDAVARAIGDETINVALVNVDRETKPFQTKGKVYEVEYSPVEEGMQWSELFPEWINETSALCPEVPMPEFDRYEEVDVVVASVGCSECDKESGWRDVGRLQVNLVVANLLVRSGRKEGGRGVFAVFIGCCGPMWEIFRCDDQVLHVGDVRVYKPQLAIIAHKLLLPVGTCQLSPPIPRSTGLQLQSREAYATVLHSSETYVCGAIALAQSIIQTNTTKELILLADDHISAASLAALRSAGWKIKPIQRIRSPQSKKSSYNEWNYSKLRLWELQSYHKVMFIDADLIVTRNLDHLFAYPQISAVANDKHLFNSGLMLLEPSPCTFRTLMRRRWLVKSYNGGDQGFLNEMFPWWHRLPKNVNQLKFFLSSTDHDHRVAGEAYALHYLGLKPWMCYKDYDCNWDKAVTRRFASDTAHARWWRVYDTMPPELRRFCALTPEMDARIRKYREKARLAKFGDGHWRIKVKDPRRIRF